MNDSWIVSPVMDTNYIIDDFLKDNRRYILVTYQKASGRRYVKQVECLYGRVTKKMGGKIVAWMPLPEPLEEIKQHEN